MVSRLLPSASNQRGAILIISSAALLGVFLIVGLVYDFGFWFVTRGQLQKIADTTALAGSRVLGALYSGGVIIPIPRFSWIENFLLFKNPMN